MAQKQEIGFIVRSLIIAPASQPPKKLVEVGVNGEPCSLIGFRVDRDEKKDDDGEENRGEPRC